MSRSTSPGHRVWIRFKRQRLGFYSLLLLGGLLFISLAAELVSNDKPILVVYQGHWYFPLFKEYPETQFGGDFDAPANYLDPFIRSRFEAPGNFALYPPNPYAYDTMNYFSEQPNPAPPTAQNLLGTDDGGRDVLARLIYGFRLSLLFGISLALLGTVLGILIGAVQGYFGGRTDLFGQRMVEVWGALPELYLLIIFASIFEPSLLLLFVLLSLFGWLSLSDYVRAEFLRNRQMEYVKAARTLGLSNWQIIRRHILPNSLTPVITFLPFRISGAILALTSLDFLGVGVPPPTPSLGELLSQGKSNLDAWWISVPTFLLLMLTLLLLNLIGDALRNALDNRSPVLPGARTRS